MAKIPHPARSLGWTSSSEPEPTAVANERSRPARVLVVDDDEGTRDLVALSLERRGHRVVTAPSTSRALDELRRANFDTVVTDLEMPPGEGGLVLARKVADGPNIPVIALTGKGDLGRAIGAIHAGVYDFLQKPVSPEILAVAVERAVRHRELSAEVVRLRSAHVSATGFDDLVGESHAIRELQDLIVRVAPAHVPVLVTGEEGTGKETVARALHRRSLRSHAPFASVSCAGMPSSLLEAELFGAGGSEGAQDGLLFRTKGGTLFIDDIHAMPLETQGRLLKLLQEKRAQAPGSRQAIEVDVRIVAATPTDLEEAVESGSFREDLLYRLGVVQLAVPPLRARGRDVLLIARSFLRRAAQGETGRVDGIAPSAARKLLAYDWPGNLRELENCIDRAVTLTHFEEITAEDLPEKITAHRPRVVESQKDGTELRSMEEVEREHMRKVLDAVGGNKTRAAKVLGFDRRTLYRKAERYGMDI